VLPDRSHHDIPFVGVVRNVPAQPSMNSSETSYMPRGSFFDDSDIVVGDASAAIWTRLTASMTVLREHPATF
jgi:hypothetical protein